MANSFAQWLIISILSRHFSLESVGAYSYFLAIISPLNLFFGLQLRNFYNSSHKKLELNDILGIRLLSTFLFIVFATTVGSFLISSSHLLSFFILLLAKSFDSFSEFSFAQKQKDGNICYIGVSILLKAMTMSLLAILASYYFHDFNLILLSILFTSFLFSLIDMFNIKLELTSKVNINKVVLRLTMPLAITSLVTAVNINIPRYILELFYGSKLVGIFSTVFFFYAFAMIISNSFIQVILNRIAKTSKEVKKYKATVLSFLKVFIVLSLLIFIGNSLLGPFIYKLAYGSSNAKYSELLIHFNYLIPLGLLATQFSYMTMAQNDYKNLLIASLVGACIHLFLSYFLIRQYQIEGAFYALAVSLIVNIILNGFKVAKKARFF